MSPKEIPSKALALLLQTGVLGLSSALASTPVQAEATTPELQAHSQAVSQRLLAIRSAVSAANPRLIEDEASGAKLMLAKWVNFGGGFGWRNGGWRNWGNGGWGNGGWRNGGWRNGGWSNGGWHNGWHNFWHNW